jgi:hypothetical protein
MLPGGGNQISSSEIATGAREHFMKIAWSDLNNLQEPGRYPFLDGFITVLEIELAIWRSNPNARFDLMRKNPIHNEIEYVLGNAE